MQRDRGISRHFSPTACRPSADVFVRHLSHLRGSLISPATWRLRESEAWKFPKWWKFPAKNGAWHAILVFNVTNSNSDSDSTDIDRTNELEAWELFNRDDYSELVRRRRRVRFIRPTFVHLARIERPRRTKAAEKRQASVYLPARLSISQSGRCAVEIFKRRQKKKRKEKKLGISPIVRFTGPGKTRSTLSLFLSLFFSPRLITFPLGSPISHNVPAPHGLFLLFAWTHGLLFIKRAPLSL